MLGKLWVGTSNPDGPGSEPKRELGTGTATSSREAQHPNGANCRTTGSVTEKATGKRKSGNRKWRLDHSFNS